MENSAQDVKFIVNQKHIIAQAKSLGLTNFVGARPSDVFFDYADKEASPIHKAIQKQVRILNSVPLATRKSINHKNKILINKIEFIIGFSSCFRRERREGNENQTIASYLIRIITDSIRIFNFTNKKLHAFLLSVLRMLGYYEKRKPYHFYSENIYHKLHQLEIDFRLIVTIMGKLEVFLDIAQSSLANECVNKIFSVLINSYVSEVGQGGISDCIHTLNSHLGDDLAIFSQDDARALLSCQSKSIYELMPLIKINNEAVMLFEEAIKQSGKGLFLDKDFCVDYILVNKLAPKSLFLMKKCANISDPSFKETIVENIFGELKLMIVPPTFMDGYLGVNLSSVCINYGGNYHQQHFVKNTANLLIRDNHRILLWGLLVKTGDYWVLNNLQGRIPSKYGKSTSEIDKKVVEALSCSFENVLLNNIYWFSNYWSKAADKYKAVSLSELSLDIPNIRLDFHVDTKLIKLA